MFKTEHSIAWKINSFQNLIYLKKGEIHCLVSYYPKLLYLVGLMRERKRPCWQDRFINHLDIGKSDELEYASLKSVALTFDSDRLNNIFEKLVGFQVLTL